jgi:hypothetical protein
MGSDYWLTQNYTLGVVTFLTVGTTYWLCFTARAADGMNYFARTINEGTGLAAGDNTLTGANFDMGFASTFNLTGALGPDGYWIQGGYIPGAVLTFGQDMPPFVISGYTVAPPNFSIVYVQRSDNLAGQPAAVTSVNNCPGVFAINTTGSPTDSMGRSSFNTLTFIGLGTGCTITVTSGTLTATSMAFDVHASTLPALTFTQQPTSTQPGQPFTPAIQVHVP